MNMDEQLIEAFVFMQDTLRAYGKHYPMEANEIFRIEQKFLDLKFDTERIVGYQIGDY